MNLIKYFALIFLTCVGATDLSAQNAKTNLVPNASFEEVQPGLRRNGQFDLVNSWSNPTTHMADIFSGTVKSKTVAAPDNMYGTQAAWDGDNYAGIVTYSPRNKVPRTYLSVQLSQKLKEKTLYCVRYRASLAERSRYSANSLGALLEKSQINEKSAITLDRTNAIYTDMNEVVDDQDGWWEYCQRYAAKGGEQYLIIGNFNSEDRTIAQGMSIPPAFEEAGGIAAAYYYIDMVEVEPIPADGNCNCASSRIPDSKVIFSGSPEITDKMTPAEQIDAIDAYFYQFKPDLVASAQRTVDKIIDIMVANPKLKVQITGHSDSEEVALAQKESSVMRLAEKRAKAVKAYMEAQGIDPERLSIKSMDNKEPVSSMSTPLSLAKNRRVEFRVQ